MSYYIAKTEYDLCQGFGGYQITDIDISQLSINQYLYKSNGIDRWKWQELINSYDEFTEFDDTLYIQTGVSFLVSQIKRELVDGYAIITNINRLCPTQTPTNTPTPTVTNSTTPTLTPTVTATRTPTPTVTPSSPLTFNLYYFSENISDACHRRTLDSVKLINIYDNDTTLQFNSRLYKNTTADDIWGYEELMIELDLARDTPFVYCVSTYSGLTSKICRGSIGEAYVCEADIECPPMLISDNRYDLCHNTESVDTISINFIDFNPGHYLYKNNGELYKWSELVDINTKFIGLDALFLREETQEFTIRIAEDISTGNAVIVDIDKLCPTSTPTLTPTHTPTPSISVTPSISISASITASISPSFSSTATPTPTITKTASATVTRTPTNSASNTNTPSATITATPSNSASNTPTPTISISNTSTNTPTPSTTNTITPTNTATPTRTATPSISISATPTATPTNSPTNTTTITASMTASPTVTVSCTNSMTPTSTITPSPTTYLKKFYYYISDSFGDLCTDTDTDGIKVISIYDIDYELQNGSFLYKDIYGSDKWIFSHLLSELNSAASILYMREFDNNISSVIIPDIDGYATVSQYDIQCSLTPTPSPTSTPQNVQNLSGQSEFTSGSTRIILSNFFDQSSVDPLGYTGNTGETIIVPANYNYAIYISDNGTQTSEFVNPGDTLTFKSTIVLGFSVTPPPTPSLSNSSTPAATPTETPPPTPSLSNSSTPAATPTETPPPTPSISSSVSQTPLLTQSPTLTQTPSLSPASS